MNTMTISLRIDKDLEQQFRKTVFDKKGMKKGNLTTALEEAIGQWISRQQGGVTST